mmetsp:Transcript_50211/g.92756  ORF Transcript_50211/g.92756 Transcript_50211/m.92756 type:complete len:246 (-) Transcript_50211:90-827(-)
MGEEKSSAPATVQTKEDEDRKDAEMQVVAELMQQEKFELAAAKLQLMSKKDPKDADVLHNLGVVLTEMKQFAEAEEVFANALELREKEGKVNYATVYGLATVLTEQGGEQKLLTAEALYRDFLVRAVEMEEKGVADTYRGFASLARNLELQKRWPQAAEAWSHTLQLSERMFGEESEVVASQRYSLARAERLGRYQGRLRTVMWVLTVTVPVVTAWYYGSGGRIADMLGYGEAPSPGPSALLEEA